ncbi:potassium channel subfamily K member 18-like [Lethenteron reissneri]|uniref:potassium channel subfamily K member 18-like n=1 Tax=Lethenteron reissneri TaxID=7753 RepID=UPI002AB63586|nr:potassium channel subfamily K member 18-like [Lethenteron reissneri]
MGLGATPQQRSHIADSVSILHSTLLPDCERGEVQSIHHPIDPQEACKSKAARCGSLRRVMSAMQRQAGCAAYVERLRKVLPALSTHVLLAGLLMIYAFLGAVTFTLIEGDKDKGEDTKLKKLVSQIVNHTVRLSQAGDMENGTKYHDYLSIVLAEFYNLTMQKPIKWNFLGSLFFCCTIFTTIGYGHIAPSTDGGKIMCMVYATFGIPIMLLVLADVGDLLARTLTTIYTSFRHRLVPGGRCGRQRSPGDGPEGNDLQRSRTKIDDSHRHEGEDDAVDMPLKSPGSDVEGGRELPSTVSVSEGADVPEADREVKDLDVPFTLIFLIVFVYLMFGTFLLPCWEEWSYLDAFYFVFVTMTTIGLGDIVPKHPNFFMLTSIYIIIGMAIISMGFKLTQDRIFALYGRISIPRQRLRDCVKCAR